MLVIETADLHDATVRGDGDVLAASRYVSAVAHNSAGRYADALLDARRASAHDGGGVAGWALAELVEAAARMGRLEEARSAFGELDGRARADGTDVALGVRARAAALIADGADAEAGYLEALERLGRAGAVGQLARTHLVYGEWLRRRQRRIEARTQLRHAYQRSVAVGAAALAARARRELLATSESKGASGALTPQEAEVARLAADGCTNPEIAGLLYLSPRTVEYHLRKVFVKLGVTSRRQLRTTRTQPQEVMT